MKISSSIASYAADHFPRNFITRDFNIDLLSNDNKKNDFFETMGCCSLLSNLRITSKTSSCTDNILFNKNNPYSSYICDRDISDHQATITYNFKRRARNGQNQN